MTGLTLVDTTLRDGTHAAAFNLADLRHTVAALDSAGVPVVEVGHGYGLGGGALPGASPLDDDEQLAVAAGARRHSRIAVLAVDGVASPEHVRRVAGSIADVVRVAGPADAPRPATALVEVAKDAGATVVGFLMLAHTATPAQLADRAADLVGAGADVVQLADSAGALLPAGFAARVAAVAERVTVPVGVHAHANLGLAVANTLAAREAGATWLDGTLAGVGAGAGNTPLEVLAAALEHSGAGVEVDTTALLSAADTLVANRSRPLPRADTASVLLARHGLYATLLAPARTIAARYGVDLSSLLEAARGSRAVEDLERVALLLAGHAP